MIPLKRCFQPCVMTALALLCGCSGVPHEKYVEGPLILSSAELATLVRDGKRPAVGYSVFCTSEEFREILDGVEMMPEGTPWSERPSITLVEYPDLESLRRSGTMGPSGWLASPSLCSEACRPVIGFGPDDMPNTPGCVCDFREEDFFRETCRVAFNLTGSGPLIECVGSCGFLRDCRLEGIVFGGGTISSVFQVRCGCQGAIQ